MFERLIYSIRLVSNKYVVSCDYSCTVKIWDLQTTRKSHSTPNAVRLIQKIPPLARPRPHERLALSLAADEFQIAVVAQCKRQSYSLNVKDFFNGAH
jgi:WD40 repeat protein